MLLAMPSAPAGARPLVPDDIFQLRTVSEPRISPDGRWIAYTVTRSMREADEDQSDLWLVSWDGRETLQLTDSADASEHHPRWSPDGRRIGFLSDRDAKDGAGDQVWLMDARGGGSRQLTRFPGAVGSFDWAPDGNRVVFAATPATDAERSGKPRPIVITRLQFKDDAVGYLGEERSHLYIQDTGSATAVQISDGDHDDLLPSWSPDGADVAFFSKRGGDPDTHNNWDVFLVEPRPGSVARQLTTNPGQDGDTSEEWGESVIRFSADGRRLAYLHGGSPDLYWYGLVQVASVSRDRGDAWLPTASLDRNTVDPAWSADGRSLYFRLEDDRSVQLARVAARGGRAERLTPAGMVVSAYDLGRGDRVVVLAGRADRPAELAALERGRLRWLTRHNDGWLAEVPLASAADIEFRSPDGTPVHGLLLLPPGARPGPGFPALLRLHGGPVSQHQHEFDFAWQYFVARGYAVIAPNPRGSTGRGARFQQLLTARWGEADVPDVLAAVDHVVAAGIADPARLGVGGWSYGAILTNYVIAADGRFRAATSGAGQSNMLAGYGVDHYVREWELELGLPWSSTDNWLRLSGPFLHADRIRTPTLFLCGEDDFNVPLVHSEQMYQALRRLGVPTGLVIYPGERHSISRPSFYVDRLQRYVAWYDRFLGTP